MNSGGFIHGILQRPRQPRQHWLLLGDCNFSSESKFCSRLAPASCTSHPVSVSTACGRLRKQAEEARDRIFFDDISGEHRPDFRVSVPDTDVWYVKPFWRKVWGSMNGVGLGSLGATTLYGEFGQYNDQFSPLAGSVCGAFTGLGGNQYSRRLLY